MEDWEVSAEDEVIHLDDHRGPREPHVLPASSVPTRLVVRIDLLDVEPPIWRRIVLGSDHALADVHHVLQATMGWRDSHLHQFVQGTDGEHRVRPFLTDVDAEQGIDEGVREGDVRLDQVLVAVGGVLHYEYDFGDGWEHRLAVEEVLPSDASARPALLLGAIVWPGWTRDSTRMRSPSRRPTSCSARRHRASVGLRRSSRAWRRPEAACHPFCSTWSNAAVASRGRWPRW